MGYTKETWMQLSDEEKCEILNSYKGKTSKWKEDNPDCSWTTATKNTNYWKDKNERFNPGLSPEFSQTNQTSNSEFTEEEIQYLKSLCQNKTVSSEQKLTLRGLNKKDVKTTNLRISKELFDRLMWWVESEENEYGFTQHEIISILVKNFMEDKIVEKPVKKTKTKSTKEVKVVEEEVVEETQEDIQEFEEPETTGIEFLGN